MSLERRAHRTRRGAIIATLVALCSLSSLREARGGADGLVAQAREHFRAGQTAYREGRFADALREFQLGYAITPRPEFLINEAQTHRKLGHLTEAVAECERFLAANPSSPLARDVRELLAQLRTEQAAQPARPATPSPVPEGLPSPSRPAPLPAPVLAPAPRSLATSHAGDLTAAPPPAAVTHRRTWPYVVIGAAVAVVAGAAIGLGLALSASDTYPSLPLGRVDFTH